MNEQEREALIALWKDVPESKPKDLHITDMKPYAPGWVSSLDDHPAEVLVTDDHAAAIARDAMVQWLAHRFCFVAWYTKGEWSVWQQDDNAMNDLVSEDVSLVMALIKACRTVAGKEGNV